MLEIHEKAKESLNSKAEDLKYNLKFLKEPEQPKEVIVDPNIPVAAHITIVGDLDQHWTDSNGNVSSRAFLHNDRFVGLFEEDYENLIKIAESFLKGIKPKNMISFELISELIFNWVKHKYKSEDVPDLVEFVLTECEKQITDTEIWIPIDGISIQSPFTICNIGFRVITKEIMDEYQSRLSKAFGENLMLKFEANFERKRIELQNKCIAINKIRAEPKKAYQSALEATEKALGILRFFAPHNIQPNKICYVAPLGQQGFEKYHYLTVVDDRINTEARGGTDKNILWWNLGVQDLYSFIEIGLNSLANFLEKEDKTDLQKKLLESVFLYSRSLLAKELTTRLIYCLVALETAFLKDSSEPIQDNISLRMAYMHPVSARERAEIISNVKKTYGLRSGFVHHGKSINLEDFKTLETFMYNSWLSLRQIIPMAEQGISRDDFFNYLEEKKLSA